MSDKLGESGRTAVFTSEQAQACDSAAREGRKSVRCHDSQCEATNCEVPAGPRRHAAKRVQEEFPLQVMH